MSAAPAPRLTVPLSRLRFGADFPGGSIDARKTRTEEGIPELLASILANGLIYPLIGRTVGTKFYVAEGNRRLKALRFGQGQGRVEKNFAVRVEEMAEAADALELSLTANIMRLPMHEVDQYEAFVALRDAGAAPAQIASRFGTSELVVSRRLALGSLSPKLRQAWREDKIRPEAAKAFTNVADHDLQDRVYASLAQGGMLERYTIIRALTGSDTANARVLRFVGAGAYEAAGGRLSRDLFAEEAHVLDPELLKRLERDKIDAEVARLLGEGWAWAALETELPSDRYRWSRIQPEPVYTEDEEFRRVELGAVTGRKSEDPAYDVDAWGRAAREGAAIDAAATLRAYTAEERARSGCMLLVTHEGRMEVTYGVLRPAPDLGGHRPVGAAPATAEGEGEGQGQGDEAAAAEAQPSEISGALAQTVSEWLTVAAADALADEPDLALRVLLAAFRCYGSPARIGRQGWSGLGAAVRDKAPPRQGAFADTFAELPKGGPHLRAALAVEVAHSLDLTAAAALHPAMAVKGGRALVDALDRDGYLKAARRSFDPSVYFDRATAAHALAAIEEMGGPKPTRKNKGAIQLAAADLARDLGWLPVPMRSAAYVPPRVAAAKEAAPARGRGKAPAPAHA